MNSSEAADRFDALQVPIDLTPNSGDELTAANLRRKAEGVSSAAADLGATARPRVDAAMAEAQAARIAQLYDKHEEERVQIALVADDDAHSLTMAQSVTSAHAASPAGHSQNGSGSGSCRRLTQPAKKCTNTAGHR